MVKIINASFIKSAPSLKETVCEGFSEVAFLGRSNVGKSSFINSLTNRKKLALHSSTPGKTRLINFFEIVYKKDDKKYFARFVDLPGFGYAKVSKSQKEEWQKNLTMFIKKRDSIRVFVHLIDSRHSELKIDSDVREFLAHIKRDDQAIIEIFTKADKLNQKEFLKLKRKYPDALFVSNLKKSGIDEANEKIFELLFG